MELMQDLELHAVVAWEQGCIGAWERPLAAFEHAMS